MVDIVNPRLTNSEIEYDNDFPIFETNNQIQHTLSQLLGYVEESGKTVLVRTDSDGNLLVNLEGSSAENATPSKATVTTTVTLIVSSRSGRNNLEVFNEGTVDVYIADDNTVSTTTGYILASGQSISFEDYVGALYGITASGSSDVRVMEVY